MSSPDGLPDTDAAPRARLDYPCGDPPPPGQSREVAPGVRWVRMPLPFTLNHINLWLLEDGDGWTAVDTGLGWEKTRELWRSIFANDLGGRPIKRVIITHMHPDHVGLAGWITRKFSASMWITRLEYVTCRLLVADTGREAPKDGEDFYRAAGWDEDALDSYRVRFGGFGKAVSRLPDSFRRISDGDAIEIGGRTWRVVTGHGHSPEHACLWQPKLELFISGDQVLPRISSNVSVFPTEPEADPLNDWIESCRKLRSAVPGDVLVLPAHNEPFRGLHPRLDSLVSGHERSLDRLEKRLREQPRRAVDVLSTLFAREIGPDLLGMATGEAIAHLNYLVRRNRASRTREADGTLRYGALGA